MLIYTENNHIIILSMNEELENINEPENSEEIQEVSETEKLTAELAEAKDKYLRLYSEFENFRRRTAKEKIETILNATEGLVKDLLPVVDDFQRAKEAMDKSEDIEALKQGVDLIYGKLYRTLENKGLKPIDVIGQPFDVELEEVVTQIDMGVDKKGIVVDELEKGYYLNDKVIRYAKVVVGS